MRKGFLVSFEGGEGCGKSTQIKKFSKWLEEKNLDYVLLREPGGTELGEKIRNILLHDKDELSSKTEFLLFSASRSKLVSDVVKPNLEIPGRIVVMDRYYDSSFAYQGYAGTLKLDDIETITKFSIGEGAEPDLTFLLDLSYDTGMSRKSKDESLKDFDRIEQKGKSYHDRVRAGYLDLAKKHKDRFCVVDASKSVDEVFSQIVSEFERRYDLKMAKSGKKSK